MLTMLFIVWASQYSPGMMDRVLYVRQNNMAWESLPPTPLGVGDYIAVVDCQYLGDFLWLRPIGQEKWERMWITDCAGPQLRLDGLTGGQWMHRWSIAVEVDYETAVRWLTVGHGIRIQIKQPGITQPAMVQ